MELVNKNQKIKTIGMAMDSKNSKFKRIEFERRSLKPSDVLIEIIYAGICHSDIHTAKEEWGPIKKFPIVPGHEIAGKIVAIGKNVKKFKIGDNAGVGCMVNSCGKCLECKAGYEQNCNKCVFTYDGIDSFNDNEITKGGYSNYIVVDEKFAIKVPKNTPLEYVAPLLCAGITTYSPIVFSKVKKGQKVAVAGFGGLGVMAAKYAKKMGAQVYMFARNKKKEKDAIKLGAKKLYDSLDKVEEKFDFIISTIPTNYNVMDYVKLLKTGGEMAIVGNPPIDVNWSMNPAGLIFNQHKKVYGSLIGGLKITQEMLDFSVKNKIYPEIEIIKPNQIDDAWEKLTTSKAKFRYVIDMKKLK